MKELTQLKSIFPCLNVYMNSAVRSADKVSYTDRNALFSP